MKTKILLNMSRFIIAIILWGTISNVAIGQTWQWVKQLTQNPNPNLTDELDIYDLKLSSTNNIYILGAFKDTINLDGTGGVGFGGTPAKTDIFLIKTDADGTLSWIKTAGSTGNENPQALDIDDSENIYIVGGFQGTCNFSGTPITAAGTKMDGFIAKYNSGGILQWAKRVATGTSDDDNERLTGITINSAGTLFVTGLFKSTTAQIGDGGVNDSTFTNADANPDLFLASYDSDGNFNWASRYANTGANSIFRGMCIGTQGNVYFGGALFGTITIEGNNYSHSPVSTTYGDIILVKANPTNGDIYWVRKGGGSLDDQLNHVTVSEDDVYISGYLQGTGTIDSTATLQSGSYTSSGSADFFLAKYNIDGRLQWKRNLGSSGMDNSYGINVRENIVVTTGFFSNSVTFNTKTITSGGGYDTGFFVFDTDGNPITAESVSGTAEDKGQGVAYDLEGNTYVGGYFLSPTLTVGTTTLTNSGSTFKDIFFAKYQNPFSVTKVHSKNVTCNGGNDGEITVVPYFGKYPYTYVWTKNGAPFSDTDSVLTGLSSGTYAVTVTDDNSEVATTSYTVTQPSTAVNATETITNVSCFNKSDGAIAITVSGGNSPYTFYWSSLNGSGYDEDAEDQTGLTDGTYSFTITDEDGCTFEDDYTVTQPDEINIPGVITNITDPGFNGGVDITPSGGSGTFSDFSWKDESDDEVATSEDLSGINFGGNYEVIVTDNTSCKDSATFNIVDERVFDIWISSQTNINCRDSATGAATVSYSGNVGTVTFSWNSGEVVASISDKTAATYTVEVTDDKGTPLDPDDDETLTESVTLSQPLSALSGSIVPTHVTCYGGSNGKANLTPSGGTPGYSYSWNTDPVITDQDLNGITVGDYEVIITDSKGCTFATSTTITQPDDIDFTVDPVEPTCNGGSNGSLSVSELTGGTSPYTYLWSTTQTSPEITDRSAGSYWIKVTDSRSCYKYQYPVLGQPAAITVSNTSIIYPTCPESTNGSIDITVSGGTGSKTFSWSGPGITSPEDEDQTGLGVGTYNLVVTDANLCTKSHQVILTAQYSSPTVTANTTDAEVCTGESVTLTGGGAVSYEWDNGVTNGVAFEPATTLTYTVTGTDSHGCIDTDQTTVTVDPLPSAPAAGNVTACYDGAAHAGTATVGAGEVVDWYDAATDGNLVSAPAGTNPGTYFAYAEARVTASGCVSASRTLVTVTIYALPTVTASATDSEVCAGESVTLTGGGAVSYLWDNGVTDGVAFVPTSTTTYTVTGTDSHGCTDTEQTTVTVYSLPTVTASATDSEVCAGESVIFSGGGAVSYEWDNGVTNGVAFEPSTTLTYTVTGTDAHGCSDTDQTTITVNSLPTVTASATDNEVCAGESVTLTGGGAVSYLWDNGVTNGVAFVPSTTLTYTVTGTDAHGCTDTEQTTVTVYSLPTVTASATDSEVCAGESVTLTGGGAVSYEWDNSVTDGVAFEPSTTLTYTVTGTDAHGCTDTDQTTVTVSSLPTVTLGVFADVCINDPAFTLTGESPSGGSFSGDGVSGTTFTPATAGSGNHTITYNYTDGHGCTNTATSSILVATVPSGGTISSNQTICSGGDPVAFASNDDPTGGKGTWSYGWESKIGSNDWTTISNADALTYDIPAGLTTTTSYRRVATNDCGTAYSNTIVITVNPLPTATISPSGTQYVCDGSSIALNANTAIGLTYRWFKDGSVITGETTSTLGVSAEGDYFAEITNQITGCLNNSNTTSIAVKPVPEASISTTDNLVWCEDENVSVTLTAVDVTSASYQWYRDGIGIPGATSKTYIAHQRGVYDVMVTVDECVSTSNSIEVIVNLLPLSVITTDDSLAYCEGIPIYTVLHASPLAADTYQWYLDGEIIIDATKDSLVATAAGEYTVQIVQTGCDAISEPITIIINPLPEVTLSNFSSLCIDSDPLTLSEGSPLNGTYSGTGVDNGIFDPEVAGTGTYSITYTFTDENGCTNSASSDITVNSLPDVSLGGFDNICINSDPLALSGGTPESGNYSGNGVIDNMFSPELAGVGLHEIVYIYTDNATGCTNSDTSSITVLDKPEVTLGEFNNICSNSSPITLSGGMPEGGAYLINGTIAEVFDPVTAGVGLHEVVYQYTDAATGCTNSDTSSITVYPLPEVTITTSDPLTYCEGATISTTFTATPSNADIYEWYKDGEIISDATSSSYTADTAGVYSVLVTVNGCSTLSSESTVTIIPLPIVSVSTLDKLTWCEGETVHTTFVSNLTSGDSYQWYKNGIAETDSTNQSYTATSSGSYSLEVAVNGCSGMSEEGVITIIPLPVVSIATSDPVSYCADQTIATTLNAFPLNADSYQWYRDGHQEIDSTGQTYLVRGVGNYFVEVTVNGCTAISEDTTITLKPLPVVSISTEDPISWCQGQTISTTITAQTDIGESFSWFKDDVLIEGATSNTITASTAGIYSVTVMANACSATSNEIVITEIQNPIVHIQTSDPASWCYGEPISVTLSADLSGAEAYQWLLNGVENPWANSQSYTATEVGSYTVKVTLGGGCSATSEAFDITTKPLPVATISTNDITAWCEGTSFTVNFTVDISDAESYQWLLNGEVIEGAITQNYSATAAGIYSVEVTVDECPGVSNEIEVTVSSSVTAEITTEDPTVWCEGQTVNTVLFANPSNAQGYQWYLNEVEITGAADHTFTATALGSYTVKVTAGGGCSATSVPIEISSISTPVASFTTTDPLTWCENEDIHVTFISDQTGAESYQWLLNGIPIADATSQTFIADTVGEYSLIVTMGGGCSDTSDITSISIIDVPEITINSADPLVWCEGSTISVTLSADQTDADAYQWYRDDALIDGATAQSYSTSEAGNFYMVATFGNCTATSNELEVILTSTPIASITTNDQTTWCEGDVISSLLYAEPEGAQSYQWLLNGVEITGADDQTFTATAAGSYTVIVTGAGGCNATSTELIISVTPLPIVSITTSDPITWCEGETISTVINADLTGAEAYSWYLNDVLIGEATEQSYTATAGGIYSVEATVNGCSNISNNITITVNPLPEVSISTTDPLAWCEETTIAVNLSAQPTDADSFLWYIDGVALPDSTEQTFSANTTGTYTVEATVNGCSALSEPVTISVYTTPVASIAADEDTTWCSNDVVPITLSAEPEGASEYQWSMNGTAIDGATNQTYITSTPGVYSVNVTLAGGCNASADIILTENQSPVVDLASDTIMIDTQKSYTLDAGTGFTSYLWSDGSTNQTLFVDGAVLGVGIFTYWVEVTNDLGCSTRDTAIVKIKLWDNIPDNISWNVELFPNPTNGEVRLSILGILSAKAKIIVYNSSGNTVFTKDVNIISGELHETMNLNEFTEGIYLIRITDGKSQVVKKIIKE